MPSSALYFNSLPAGKFCMHFVVCRFFSKLFLFQKIILGIPSECQTALIQIRPDILSGLIWIQNCLCKDYHQQIKVFILKSVWEYHIRVSNSFNPHQAGQLVQPDLGSKMFAQILSSCSRQHWQTLALAFFLKNQFGNTISECQRALIQIRPDNCLA